MERSFTQEAVEAPQEQNNEESVEEDVSNDLKEFGVDTDEPDLFNPDDQDNTSEDLLSTLNDESEEDDLEIPAFLRRQKN